MKYSLISFLFLVLITSCCPKCIPQAPVIVRDTVRDSVYTPQPPIIIPADEFEIGYLIQEICDSTWRVNHPVITGSGKRLTGSGTFSRTAKGDSLKFTCHEDQLIIERDSLKHILEKIREKETQTLVLEKCPMGWPKWIHHVMSVLAFIGLISVILVMVRLAKIPPW